MSDRSVVAYSRLVGDVLHDLEEASSALVSISETIEEDVDSLSAADAEKLQRKLSDVVWATSSIQNVIAQKSAK